MPSADPVLLLLPGMSLNATTFPAFPYPALAPNFSRFVPGTGRGMEPYLEALDRLVDDPLWTGAADRVVVGHSFGGMLALVWLLRHRLSGPAAVRGLVLVGTTAGPMFDAVRIQLARVGDRELRVGIKPFLPAWYHGRVTRGVKRLLNGGTLRTRDVDFRALRFRSDLAVGVAGWRNTDWAARRSYRWAMDGFDVRDRLSELELPAIVLHGKRDRLFPVAAAETLARGLPRAELRVLPDAGHIVPLTHGEAVRAAVEDVLSVKRETWKSG
ncbi:MAG: alpha/beta hydrolase [Gemmatimonadota bacterium]|nr:alpha/beta hydrolase [Gemmatimonadota bacterium]